MLIDKLKLISPISNIQIEREREDINPSPISSLLNPARMFVRFEAAVIPIGIAR